MEGTTIYHTGNPTLGAIGYNLTQAELVVDLPGTAVVAAPTVWQPPPVAPPAPRWYSRLWSFLTRPRTLWWWLTPWR